MLNKKISILVIEDNPADRRFIEEILKESGSINYKIKFAETLNDGLSMINNDIDVILLDLNLPDSNGIETLKKIQRANISTIIILSGMDDFDLANESIKYGAQDYLVKGTFDYNLLIRSINYSIERFNQNQKLIKSEENFRVIFETAPNLILILNSEKRIIICNDKIKQFLGYSYDEVLGKEISGFIHPENKDTALDVFNEVNIKGCVYNKECKMIRKDGSFINVYVNSSIYNIDYEKGIYTICIIDDITERKQTEAKDRLVSEVLEILNTANETENAVHNILIKIKNNTNFEAVAIRLRKGNNFPYYESIGFTEIFIKEEMYLCAHDKSGNIIRDNTGNPVLECMCGNVLIGRIDPSKPFFTKGGSFWTNSTTKLLSTTTDDDRMTHTRNRCNIAGYESVALIPLKSGGEMIGLLQLNDRRNDCFTLDMIHFFEGLGSSIGIALSRKQSEIKIRESEERYKMLFEQAADPVALIDPATMRIIEANNKTSDLLGYSREELITMKITDLDVVESHIETLQHTKMIIEKNNDKFETKKKCKNGKILDIEVTTRALLLHDKNVIQAVWRDITERKQIDNELKFNNIILSTQQEASIDGILAVDENGKIISYNKRFTEIWEIPPDVIESKSDELTVQSVLNKITDSKKFLEGVDYLYKHQNETSFDEIILLDGKILDRYSAPMIGQEGKYYGRIWYFRDITERKKSEKMLIESEKMTEIAHLSAGVAHEFNNILAVIKSTSQLLLLEESLGNIIFDKRIKDELTTIDKQTKRGADIVSNLMLFSKPDKAEKEYVFIEDIIDDVIKLHEKQFEIENIEIIRNYHNKDKLLLNSSQIQQVFLNLTINSRHAIRPKGKGNIVITTKNDSKNVIVTFSDDGIGMSDETKKNIFKPFFTTKGASAKDDLGLKGTGLGLAVTDRIIKEYNGSINVESNEGKDSDFIIVFPLESSQTKEIAKRKDDEIIMNETYNKDINILIVDDEINIVDNLAKTLKVFGFKNIDVNYSSVKALNKFKNKKFKLFFIDMMMPEIKGDVLVEKLLNDKKHSKSNMIIMSGSYDNQIKEIMALSEKCFFLKKPFSSDDILEILNKIFEES